jgi:catechol 2,3-dioxygenase-like lactoylglutathione lyase family enzyme
VPSPPRSLDHVALWVADRDALADLLCGAFGLHVIERTDAFTLVGAEARLGKLTLFAAEGPRETGALERVVLRVADVDAALARLPAGTEVARGGGGGTACLTGPEGLGLGVAPARPGQVDGDLDHVVLRVADPATTGRALVDLGFTAQDGLLAVGDRHLRLMAGDTGSSTRPLLNHLALLVDDVDAHLEVARGHGVVVEEIRDAPNTYAGFVRGPEGILLEYVEHKPTFALR